MEENADLLHITNYHTCLLSDQNVEELEILLDKCSDYFLLVDGHRPIPSTALNLLNSCPPGKASGEKVDLGIYTRQNRLIGVLDAVRDYPGKGDWWVGLLLLDPLHRDKGIGRKIIRSFEAWIREQCARQIFLGVIEANNSAYKFWKSMGFTEVERQPPQSFGERWHVVITMAHDLIEVTCD
jgi:GNAT superfamily N-acetyltransferase